MKLLSKIIQKFFKKKLITIPLMHEGVKTGQWVECYKGDDLHKKLIEIYGLPLPTQINIKPIDTK